MSRPSCRCSSCATGTGASDVTRLEDARPSPETDDLPQESKVVAAPNAPVLAARHRVVTLNAAILNEQGIHIGPESAILDFGCGRGRHVYEHLDLGYRNIYGYDIRNYVDLRDPADIGHFRFDPGERMIEIPFPDASFDFIYSYSVFEHVMEPELAFREIYRVLKPGGVSLHNFPSRWRPIEPHTFVPFGGVFRSEAYFYFWALMGIRNGFQKGLSARETARRNHVYGQTGINYPSGREIDRLLNAIFDHIDDAEFAFLAHSPGRSKLLYRPVRLVPWLVHLFRFFHTRVILLHKADARAGMS